MAQEGSSAPAPTGEGAVLNDGEGGGGGYNYGLFFLVFICMMFAVLFVIVYAIFRIDTNPHHHHRRPHSCPPLCPSTGATGPHFYTFSSGPIGVGGIFIGMSTGGGLALGMGVSDGAGGVIGIPTPGIRAMLNMARIAQRDGTLSNLRVHLNAGPSDDLPAELKVGIWTAPCDDQENWTESALQVTHLIDIFDSHCISNTTDTIQIDQDELFVIWVQTTDGEPVQLLSANVTVEFN